MSHVVVVDHPLIQHKMSIIRDYRTGNKDFREALNEISGLITYEISRNFETVEATVTTPIQETTVRVLRKDVVIVPILRAGLGMVDGIHNMIPTAKIGHVGLYRDETTLEPVEYYAKFPDLVHATVLVVDPMLATGGSASFAVSAVKKRGAKDIRYVGLVGCPEGVARLQHDHPEVDIYLAAMDERLNDVGYIVPGLGDCGDRLFGTR
jgi:uracil phosphoribosyltransferase